MEPGEADGPGPGVEAQSSTAQESSMEASLSPLQEGAKALATEQECDTVSSTTTKQILEAPLRAENAATNTLLQNAAEAVFESPLPEKSKAGTETLPMLGSVAAIETLSQVAPEPEEETPITMAEAASPATKDGTITLDPPEEIPVLTGVDLAVNTVQSTALAVEAPSSHEAPSLVVSPISTSMPSITGDSVSAGSDLPQDTLSAVAVDSTVPSAVGTLSQIAALKSVSTMSTTVSEPSTSSEPVLSPSNQPLALATAEPGPPDADTMSPKELLPSETMGPVQELQLSVPADPGTDEPAIGQHVQVEMQTIASETCQELTSTPATVLSSSLSMGADLSDPFEPPSAALDAGPDQEQQAPFVEALSFSGGEQTSQPGLTVEAKIVAKDLPLSSCSHQAEPLPSVASEQILASGSKSLHPVLDAANIFDNNLVSSVDGETVLIVEGLGVSSSSFRNKTDGDFPGTGGVRVATDLQNEADEDRNVRPMHAERTDLVGQKVKKRFGRKHFEGDVISYDPELKWYKVVYEDGDEEELEFVEVEQILFPPSAEKQGNAEHGGSANKRPKRSSGSRRDLRRDSKKGEEFGVVRLSPEAVDKVAVVEVSEKNNQTQENMNFRLLRKRNVIDTSNEMGDEPFNDEVQSSESSEDNSEIKEKSSESQDDPAVEKISRSHRKLRGKKHSSEGSSRLRKRRKLSGDLNVKESVPHEPTLRSRHKPEPALKTQETPTEHRVATRSSTGSLSAHISPSDGRSSPRFKKGAEDSEDKTKLDSPAACMISPLGGGSKLIGRRTRKDFGGQFYSGEIIGYDSRAKYYKVRYEDGDEEELEWSELESTVVPVEEEQKVLSLETPNQAVRKLSKRRLKEHSRRIRAPKAKEGALILYDGGASNGDLPSPTRWRKKIRTASVSVMMKGTEDWAAPATPSMESSRSPPRPLAAARFASASDADIFEYFGWGEVVNFEKGKCPELRAARLLPTSSPIIHLAASRHHLAAITAAGQVWVWRCKHGNIHTRCGEWEHVSALDERSVILVDISGPDLDRPSAGYDAEQEDQAPDFFYLAAICSNGEDIILQGSQPHELVHIYQYNDEPRHLGLREALLHSNLESLEDIGRIVQVTVGMVEAVDESPFVGYITDTDRVYIRSATRDYMEEFNLVTGYTGKPIKIQCGRVYHAIIMTDDGRAWTWGQGYYPGSNSISANFSSKWSSPYCLCQPAVGTLVGRKVVDVGCYGEDFIALTNDGDVHQWTHAVPNPAAGVYNVPATPINGQGPSIASGDKLKQVSIGAGVCAGITECGKVHSWRTAMKGGFAGIVGLEREALTPLGRDEGYKETVISSLGTRFATKMMCIASSLIVVVKRKTKLKRGGKKKSDVSLKGKVQDKLATG